MKPKTIAFGAAAALFLSVVAIVVWKRVAAGRDAAEYKEQLKLARAEGIPTTAAEFAATIPPAKPEENAAALYRQLQPLVKALGNPQEAEVNLLANPSPKTLTAAKSLVQSAQTVYALLDTATEKPRCWFDRDWSEGAAVLLPEFAQMKAGARFLALRGSIAAAEGRVQDALKDARRIFVISKHAGEEGTGISASVAEAIYFLDLHDIATWCVEHPGVTEYRDALEQAVRAIPKRNIQRENRDRLWLMLDLTERSLTPKGQRELGLKPGDVGVTENLASAFANPARARVEMVKAGRDYFKALDLPQSQMSAAVDSALKREDGAIEAFPAAANVMNMIWAEVDPVTPLTNRQMHQAAYAVALEAFDFEGFYHGAVPRTLDTSHVGDKFGQFQIKYVFDGKRMLITVTGPPGVSPLELSIPPNVPNGPPVSVPASAGK